MKAARPGRFEYEVEAAIEQVYLRERRDVAGLSLHRRQRTERDDPALRASTPPMQDGDLLLVDAAANYQGLTGDITRTYPVNGTFTPAQRDIYELVLAAQEAGIAAAQAGSAHGRHRAGLRRRSSKPGC